MADQEKQPDVLHGQYRTTERILYYPEGAIAPLAAKTVSEVNYAYDKKQGLHRVAILTREGNQMLEESRKIYHEDILREEFKSDYKGNTYRYKWNEHGDLLREEIKMADKTVFVHQIKDKKELTGKKNEPASLRVTTVIDPESKIETFEHEVFNVEGDIIHRAGLDIEGHDYLDHLGQDGKFHGYQQITKATEPDAKGFSTNSVTIFETVNGEKSGMIYEYTQDGATEDVVIMRNEEVDLLETVLANIKLTSMQIGDWYGRNFARDIRSKEKCVEARAKVMTKKFANE